MIVTMFVCVCIMCSDTVEEDDDLYDFVEDEENKGDEIYEDLMRTDEHPEMVSGTHTRSQTKTEDLCCLLPGSFAGLSLTIVVVQFRNI